MTQTTPQSTDEAAAPEAQALADRQGDAAADYLEGLLDILDLDGDIEIEVQPGRAVVSVVEGTKGDLEHLVGQDGTVLAALQDLTRLAVTTQTGARAHVSLDIAGHRARKRDAVRAVGLTAIAEAKDSGQPVRLAAMTAFERKVIHDTVAEAGLRSESEGVEPHRYVVVQP
jgi:spoIIIJ-associated protein